MSAEQLRRIDQTYVSIQPSNADLLAAFIASVYRVSEAFVLRKKTLVTLLRESTQGGVDPLHLGRYFTLDETPNELSAIGVESLEELRKQGTIIDGIVGGELYMPSDKRASVTAQTQIFFKQQGKDVLGKTAGTAVNSFLNR